MSSFTKRVYETVGRHFISLSCVQCASAHAKEKILVFSGFLVEIADAWFYVTAGHILRDIRIALDAGSTFDIWRLGDQTGGNKFNGVAIPYAFDLEQWFVLEDSERGLDYAAVPLGELYRRLIAAGGSVPIAEDARSDHFAEHNFWVLIGIPSETVEYDEETIIKASVIVAPLTPADEPQMAGARAENQFYARLSDDSTDFVKNADGLSGGPIFAFRKIDGVWNYWVIGVQSSWYQSTRTLAACPFSSFAMELEKVVHEAREHASHDITQADAN